MFPAGRAGLSVRHVALPSGLHIRLVEAGPLEGRRVLLLHGWGASSYMWRAWFAPLADAGFRVTAPDLPGHGLSDKPEDEPIYRLAGLVDLLRALLDAEGAREVDVVAQSMSGTIAATLAMESPGRVGKLALVNPALFGRVRMERIFKLMSPRAIDVILPRLVGRWIVGKTHRLVYGDPSKLTRRDVDEYWAPSQFPAYARAMRRLLHVFNWKRDQVHVMTRKLEPLASRLLVILGTKDRLVMDSRPYVEQLCAQFPQIQVHTAVGGGHAVNEERPEELVPVVRSFLLSS